MYKLLWHTTLAISLLALMAFVFRRWIDSKQSSLSHIPIVEFTDGDNSAERYLRDSESLLHQGYLKYIKNGTPFRVRSPVYMNTDQLILPWKYLKEVRNAPRTKLSLMEFNIQTYSLDYCNGTPASVLATSVMRDDLNKNLGNIIPTMFQESELSMRSQLPACQDWTEVAPYMPIAYAVARISARAFVGEDLAHNDEWVRLCIQITGDTMAAARELRQRYHKEFRWLARWFLPGAQKLLRLRRRAAQLLTPQVQNALANPDAVESNGIQWYISRLAAKKKTLDIQQLADDNMFIAIASVHATSSTVLSILYDLIDRPDDRQEIMDEIRNVWAEEENGTWSKTGLMKLEKLDSFMKESQRFHPLGMEAVQRCAVQDFTFKDGFKIPRNTWMFFLNRELFFDQDIYENPEIFDPWRFLKMKSEDGTQKHLFSMVSDTSLHFGAGNQACPGRFFSAYEIKMILIHFLTQYELRWPKRVENHRPPDAVHDYATHPDRTKTVMLKEKVM